MQKYSFFISQHSAKKKGSRVRTLLASILIILAQFQPLVAMASGPSSNRLLNYQIRLTSSTGVPVANGTQLLRLTIYDAPSAGNQLYTACSTDGSPTATPTAVNATFFNGTSTVLLGDALDCSSGDPVPLPTDLFDNGPIYLGVTVQFDAEMTPRKRITASGFAMNSDKLDDLETSSAGGVGAYVPVTDINGNFATTKDVSFDGTTFFVDSANSRVGIGTVTPGALFSVGSGSPFQIDGSGNVTTSGDVAVNGGDITTTAGVAAIFNTNATTVNIGGAATTVSIGASTGTLTVNNAAFNLQNGALQTGGVQRLSLAGALGNITGYAQTSGTFAATLTAANAATFSSSTANSDSIAVLPQSSAGAGAFTGTLTSADLTAARTWTLPNASGTLAVSASAPLNLDAAGNLTCATCTVSGGTLFTLDSTSGSDSTISQGGTVTLTQGSNLTVTGDGSGGVTFAVVANPTFATSVNAPIFQNTGANLVIQTVTSGEIILQPAGAGVTAIVHVGAGGAGSTTPDMLGLDVKSDAGDPSGGEDGVMYYNESDEKFRCHEGDGWKDCITEQDYAVSSLTDAIAANMIANGDYTQDWHWLLTTADQVGMHFSEHTASTAAGAPSLVAVSTLAGSTATPLYVENLGDGPSFRVDDEASDATPFYVSEDGNVAIGAESFDPLNPEKLKVDGGTSPSTNIISGYGDLDSFLQLNIHNRNAGENASSDLVATADNGNSDEFYIDVGINSSGYNNPDYSITGPNDGYLFVNGGDLAVGTQTPGTEIIFHVGGTEAADEVVRIDSAGNVGIGTSAPTSPLDVMGEFRISGATSGFVGFDVPAVAGSTTYTLPSADGLSGYALTTDGSGVLSWTDSTPNWQRTGTILSPVVAGDDVTTSGDMYTSGTGTITSAGLLTGSAGLTALGGTVNLNVSSNFNTNINTGTSTGAVTIGNAASGTVTVVSAAPVSITGGSSLLMVGTTNIGLQPSGAGTSATVQIGAGGAGSTTPDVLNLDVKSNAGDPTGANGAMYYNANSNKFRCYINGSWSDCDTTGGTTTLQTAYNNGNSITTAGSTDILFTLTSGGFAATGAGAVSLTPTAASQFTSGGALTFTAGAASTWGTSSGNLSLQINGTGTGSLQVGLGTGTATPDLIVMDVKNTAGDPAGTNGAMYYNANSNVFRCFENSGWKDCDTGSGTPTVTLQQAYAAGNSITTSGSTNILFTLTSGNFNATGAGSVNLTPTSASQFTSGGALTFTAGAASTWSTSSGALTIDAAAALNLGTTNATSVSIGRTGVTTTNNGALTSAETLTASDGFTQTTGTLSLTATGGAISASGLGASSISTGANALTLVGSPININATGSGTTFIGSATGAVNLPGLTASRVVFTDASKNLTSTGTVAINQGGTGQTTQTAAYDALSPTTTKGDLVAHNGTNNVRLAVGGTNGFVLTVDSTQATGMRWAVVPGASLQSAYNGGNTITTASSTDIAFTLASGSFTATGAGAVSLTPSSASTFTSGAALTFTAGAASVWSTTSGNLRVDSAAVLNLGTTAATSVSIGRSGVTTTSPGAFTVSQATTLNGGLAVNTSGSITTDQTTFNLVNTSATTLNIGGAAGAGGVNIAGGSASTGCTVDGSNGNFTCSGNITTTATSGSQGWWSRSGTTLTPVNSGDSLTISGAGAFTSGTGTTTINGTSIVMAGNSTVLDMTGTGTLGLNTVTNRAITTGTGLLTSGGALTATGLATANGGVLVAANQNVVMASGTGTYAQTNTGTTNTAMTVTASALTTGTAIAATGSSVMTTGSLLSATSGTYVHTTSESGSLLNLSFTDASSNGSGSAVTNGINIASTINTTASAGAKTVNAINVPAPTLTACGTTAGSCTWNGLSMSTPALTQTTTNSYSFNGFQLGTAGALVQNTAAGTIAWNGGTIQMPNTTQTTGSVTATGLRILGGTVTSGTAYALVTGASAGNVGLGTLTPTRKLDVNGSVGTNEVISQQSLTSSSTVTITTEAGMYYLENNQGTTNADVTTTFNITGLPDVDGTFAIIQLHPQKGTTAAARTQTVILNIHGNFVTDEHTEETTIATQRDKIFTVARINGAWKVVGSAGTGAGTDGGVFVQKSVINELTSTNTTPVDTELSFDIAAGETWSAFYSMRSYNSSNANDTVYSLSAPSGATCYLSSGTFKNGTSSSVSTCGSTVTPTVGTSYELVVMSLTVVNGVNDGTVTLRFNNTAGGSTAYVGEGSHMAAFLNQGADLAESYNTYDFTMAPGHVVALDPSLENGVKKSDGTPSEHLMGVISTMPGLAIGGSDIPPGARPVFLALAGRVPVAVSTENGPIEAGDMLTASSVPGVAMKATEAGQVVGRAISGFAGEGIGQVVLFVQPGYFLGHHETVLPPDAPSLVDEQPGSAFTGGSFEAHFSIDAETGALVTKMLAAERFAVVQTDEQSAVGSAVALAGTSETVVLNSAVRVNSRILLTPRGNFGTAWWVDSTLDGSFTVKTSEPVPQDVPFDYWTVDVLDRRTSGQPEPEVAGDTDDAADDDGSSSEDDSAEEEASSTDGEGEEEPEPTCSEMGGTWNEAEQTCTMPEPGTPISIEESEWTPVESDGEEASDAAPEEETVTEEPQAEEEPVTEETQEEETIDPQP